MSAFIATPPFTLFYDSDGTPLENGYIYLGELNLNPLSNPVTAYWDEALTIPALQPIRTLAGYPSRDGTPSNLYTRENHSIVVQNKNQVLVYSSLDSETSRYTYQVTNVKAYGCVGDNVTDDTDNFNEALAQGGLIFVPRGQYIIDSGNLNVVSNSILFGEGSDSKILITTNGDSDNRRIDVNVQTNVHIRDLYVEETGVNSRTGLKGVITFTTCTNVTVTNVEIQGSSSVGIFSQTADGITIEKCYIWNNIHADGIHMQRGCKRFRIANNHIANTGDDSIGISSHKYTLYGHNDGGTIIGNICRDHRVAPVASSGSGVALIGAINTIVEGNYIDNVGGHGIRVASLDDEGLAVAGKNIIANNIINDAGDMGMNIANCRDITVRGNQINKPNAGASNGINLTGSWINVVLDGNKITQANRGINITASEQVGDYLNLWTDPELTDGDSLAYVYGHVLAVKNNEIYKTAIDGINVIGSASRDLERITIKNNTIQQANTSAGGSIRGVYTRYCENIKVIDNIVTDAASALNKDVDMDDSTAPYLVKEWDAEQYLLHFYQDNVTASQTAVQLDGPQSSLKQYLCVFDGMVYALSIRLHVPRTAGTLTCTVYKSGAAQALATATLDATTTQFDTTVVEPFQVNFVAGDRLDVRITTDGSFAPANPELLCELLIRQ